MLIKVFQPAYFAREDMRTPFYFSIVMMVTNVGLSLALFPTMGHVGIAIATSVSAWVNFVLLAATLWFRGQYRPVNQTLYRVMMIIVSSAVMGALLWYGHGMIADQLASAGFVTRAFLVLGLIGASAIIYFTIIILTGVISKTELKSMLKRG